MKKLLLAGCGLLLAGVVVLAAAGFYLLTRLDKRELEKQLLAQARATLGTEVKVRAVEISLLSGVELRGITVANPAPFAGELLTADCFVLRYRLLPLLLGRFEVERLALDKPVLSLAMDARGGYNYERLGRPVAKAAPAARTAAAPPAGAPPLRILMKSLAVEDATIRMTDYAKARLMNLQAVAFKSAFELEGGTPLGAGQVTIGSADLGELLFVRGVRAPLTMSKEKVTLSPIRGDVADGSLTGDLNVDLKGGLRYSTRLVIKGASVKKLLAEAKSAALVSGTLAASARFEGTGGLPTMRGEGSAEVAACRAENSRVLALVASVLQVPELARPDFEICRVEFKQTGSRFATPVVKLTGDAVRLSGAGTLNLDTSGLDYDLSLALAPRLFAKVTRPELRGAFKQEADGFSAIPFHLSGTTLEPKTDILSRLGKAAATGAAKEQLGKLLRKKGL